MPNAAESSHDYESIPNGCYINNIKQAINGIYRHRSKYSVKDYLSAVTANLILIIRPEPIKIPLHQTWIYRCTALKETILDGAAQKCFSF